MKKAIVVSLVVSLLAHLVIISIIVWPQFKEEKGPAEVILKPVVIRQPTKEEWVDLYYKIIRKDNIIVVKETEDKTRKISNELAWEIAKLYFKQEELYGLQHGLLVSLVHYESWHDPEAISSKRARGLTQVKIIPTGKAVGKQLGIYQGKTQKERIAKVMDPINNVILGSTILSDYLQECNGDIEKALAKYSCHARGYSKKILNLCQVLSLVVNSPSASIS